MANFFKRNQAAVSPAALLNSRYNSARMDLLLVVVLTLVNFFMLFFGDGTYFLFSAAVPYSLAVNAMYLCGKFPPEFYEGDMMLSSFLDDTVFTVMIAIAVVILAVYLLCFFMSSKHRVGWLIAALALFVVDTAAMLWIYGIAPDMMIDLVIHVIVIVYLALGVHAAFKLKSLEAEPTPEPQPTPDDDVSHFFENNG